MKALTTLLDAIGDPKLFGPWFKKRSSWENWLIFLSALFALPMTPQQLAVYQQCTGREVPTAKTFSEVWLCIGRRGGKSFILALIAVYLSCFREYRQHLAAGERGTVVIIAQDRKAARTIFRYVKGLLHNVPMLKRMIERETADTFDLSNRISIEIHVASFRSSRGATTTGVSLVFTPGARKSKSAREKNNLRQSMPGSQVETPPTPVNRQSERGERQSSCCRSLLQSQKNYSDDWITTASGLANRPALLPWLRGTATDRLSFLLA